MYEFVLRWSALRFDMDQNPRNNSTLSNDDTPMIWNKIFSTTKNYSSLNVKDFKRIFCPTINSINNFFPKDTFLQVRQFSCESPPWAAQTPGLGLLRVQSLAGANESLIMTGLVMVLFVCKRFGQSSANTPQRRGRSGGLSHRPRLSASSYRADQRLATERRLRPLRKLNWETPAYRDADLLQNSIVVQPSSQIGKQNKL